MIPEIGKGRQQKPNRLLAEWIGGDMLPPYMVHGRGFRKFMNSVLPGWKIPRRTTITRITYVPQLVEIVNKEVKDDT